MRLRFDTRHTPTHNRPAPPEKEPGMNVGTAKARLAASAAG
jgi:hypothetical protein